MKDLMSMDEVRAVNLLERKFFEFTADNFKKCRGRNYICDHDIHYAFDFRHPNDTNYIGITCRFLYNEKLKKIIGFKVYELFKGETFVEGVSTIGDGIEVGIVHETAFLGCYHTVKSGDRFTIEQYRTHNYTVQEYVEVP